MPYPVRADLAAYLQEQGMAPSPAPSDATLDRRLAAAVQGWERDSGWRPFLSTGVPETRAFHASYNGLVDLGGGLLSLASVALGTTAFALGTDLRAEAFGGDVATALTLLRGGAGPLAVTGVWGRVAEVPPDVFEAVLARAALSFVPTLLASVGGTGAVKKETAGPVTYEYDVSVASLNRGKAGALEAVYAGALEAWRRVAIV